MSMRDRLVRLAALKLLGDEVKRVVDADKAALMEEVGGRLSAAAAVVDGVEVGTISIAEGKYPAGTVDGWQVYDPTAFLKWCKKHRPSAVMETVRSSDVTSILRAVPKMAEEGLDVPDGIRLVDRGDGYVVVNQTPAQREAAIRAWRLGTLNMPGMEPQIEEAES